jgi:hypothetical protein
VQKKPNLQIKERRRKTLKSCAFARINKFN